KDYALRAFPSFNSAVIALRSGEVAAALSSPPALNQMPEAQRQGLVTLATSKPGLPLCYLAHPNLSDAQVQTMTRILLEFGDTPEGVAFFQKTGYEGYVPLTTSDLRAMDAYVAEIKPRL
ncbi:MAG: phosphate/phosphite/phosphonate ABC transporter substrate-binding protein, partial [Gammaproteobacteria bacterium]|nr:phosphate/phosphite/phosphonate ABC transporter substrate-binding protein [Gammaproteobacteria bacterium]